MSHISGFCKGINELRHGLFFISNDKLENIDIMPNPIFITKPPLADKALPMTIQILAYNLTFLWYAVKVIREEKPDVICGLFMLLENG